MELIRNDVVLKFSKEDVKALDEAIRILKEVDDICDTLDYEDYDTEELNEHYSAFGKDYVMDLATFSLYIKENDYVITIKR